MEVAFVEAFTEASVEVTSVKVSVEAFMEASMELTSDTFFDKRPWQILSRKLQWKLPRFDTVGVSMENSTLPWKLS